MNIEVTTNVLLLAFIGAVLMGAIAHKTNFCTMGSVSDWVNMGSTGRLGAWFSAIAVAIVGVLILQLVFEVPLESTIPPYTTSNFAWLRYVLGGLMFGTGMTLAGGCGSKTLINIGAGSLRSLFVLLVAVIMAYLMTKTAFYEIVFHSWINASTIDLTAYNINSQSLVSLLNAVIGSEAHETLHISIASLLAAAFFYMAFASKQFRQHSGQIFAGFSIGLIIVFGWYISGGPLGQEAIETAEWMEQRPLGVGVQSYTFINPMGELLAWGMSPGNLLLVTYGVMALLGLIMGSFISALVSGTFKITGFTGRQDVVKHLVGGVLMGTGGVLAMGCTIGQGITGVSTLAVGSLLALFSIIIGSALTLKTSYYSMMYDEDEGGTFVSCLLSALVDFKLLPEALRKLEQP